MKLDEHTKGLTVNERFMLHILAYQAYVESWEAPYEITQKGVAEGIGINRGEVPRAAKALKAKDLVLDERKHIFNETRKKVVYFLTRTGLAEAVKIRNHLIEQGYEPAEVRTEEEARQVKKRALALPGVDYFFGRDKELELLKEIYGMDRRPMLFIYGMAGIGKTTLVLNFLSSLKGDQQVVWHKSQGFDSLDYLVKNIGRQLALPQLEGSVDLILREVVGHIFETQAVVFIDDIHKLNPQVLLFLELVKEKLEDKSGGRGPMFIITARSQPRLYDVRDLKIKNTIREVNLAELDRRSSLKFIDHLRENAAPAMSSKSRSELYEMTRGYPLAIELLQMGSGAGYKAFDDFIKEEIMPGLSRVQERMLTYLANYRIPFGTGALRTRGQDIFELADFDELVQKRVIKKELIELGPSINELYSLHESIRQFFGRRVLPRDLSTFRNWCMQYYEDRVNDAKDGGGQLEGAFIRDLGEFIHFTISSGRPKKALEYFRTYNQALAREGYHEDVLRIADCLLEAGTGAGAGTGARAGTGAGKGTRAAADAGTGGKPLSGKEVLELKMAKEALLDHWGRWDIFLEHMFFARLLERRLKEQRVKVLLEYELLGDRAECDPDEHVHLRDSLKELEAVGDGEGAASVYRELAWLGLLSMNPEAEKDIKAGSKRAGKKDREMAFDLELMHAELLFQNEDYTGSGAQAAKLLKGARGDHRDAFVLTLMGNIHLAKGDLKKAALSFGDAEQASLAAGHIKGVNYSRLHRACLGLVQKGLRLKDTGDILSAAGRAFSSIGDDAGCVFTAAAQALHLLDEGDRDAALDAVSTAMVNYGNLDIRSRSFADALETLKYHIKGSK